VAVGLELAEGVEDDKVGGAPAGRSSDAVRDLFPSLFPSRLHRNTKWLEHSEGAMRVTVILTIGLALVGCTESIKMRNPKAGEIATRGPYPANGIPSLSTPARESQCIGDYQRQGFERAP
jgi:hypothetical protein